MASSGITPPTTSAKKQKRSFLQIMEEEKTQLNAITATLESKKLKIESDRFAAQTEIDRKRLLLDERRFELEERKEKIKERLEILRSRKLAQEELGYSKEESEAFFPLE